MADGNWSLTYFPAKEQTLLFTLTIDNILVVTRTAVVSGRSPFSVDPARTLGAATLLSQAATVTEPIDSSSSSIIFMQESSIISVPVFDVFGAGFQTDPGLRVQLTLVPGGLEPSVVAGYRLPLSAPSSSSSTSTATSNTTTTTVSGRRRQLLQLAPLPTGPTNVTNNASNWMYLQDYEEEASDPWLLETGGAPQVLVLQQAGPDTGNPLQDGLAANASFYTFPGEGGV